MVNQIKKRERAADVRIGTIICGTLRDEDLFDAFLNELERVSGTPYPEWRLLQTKCADDGWELSEHDGWVVSDAIGDMWDRLNEYRPDGVYFGNHEDDGADFGWWPIPDSWGIE